VPDIPDGTPSTLYDIRYNCWDDDFDTTIHLSPSTWFISTPHWCPGESRIESEDEAKTLYNNGLANIESQNYSQAESTFKQIVSDYPNHPSALNALKKLYSMEPVYRNDFILLKNYYDSIYALQLNDTLRNSSWWLSLHCNVQLGNYQQSINLLDSVITNPDSKADSIFAIIDMGYIFSILQGDTILKYTLMTIYPEHIPSSYRDYSFKRNILIKELLEINLQELDKQKDKPELSDDHPHGCLLGNIPNPFFQKTNIHYKTNISGKINIILFSVHGRKIREILIGEKGPGIYNYLLNVNNFSSGIYYYSLSLNGQIIDTDKMIFIK
jgi:tetratricopeptide (TPR) repeat protein